MHDDELKALWAAHGELLTRSLRSDERLLSEQAVRRARRALLPFAGWRALELLCAFAAVFIVGSVLAGHGLEWRYLVAGWPVLAYFVTMAAAAVRLLAGSRGLDAGAAVADVQTRLLRLRAVGFWALKWAVLGGVVVWLPAALLLFEAVTGVAALQRVDLAWLLANLGFGVVLFALAMLWSRRRRERGDLGPRMRAVLDALTDRGVRRALAELEDLRRFVRDDVRDDATAAG